MKPLFYFAVLFSASTFFVGCKKEKPIDPAPPENLDIHPPPKLGFMVISYFPYYRDVNEYPDRMFRMCNVINYAFAHVNASHRVTIAAPDVFNAVYQKAKANGVKVFLSVAGESSFFASMSSTAGGRTIFIEDIMRKVRQYKLDGIDIDWEYPRSNDGTAESYTLLMKQLSDSLHVDGKYYLSAAITPGLYTGSIREGIKNEVFQYVDFLNVMVYDNFTTNPDYPYMQHSPFSMVTTCMDYWVHTRGLDRDKCILGIPAYGRPSGMTQSGTTLTYKTILEQGGNPLLDSAIVSAGGFTDYTIYYNGQPTVKKKAAYAQNNGGGIMFWEMGQDAPDDRSLIKAACDTLGIDYE